MIKENRKEVTVRIASHQTDADGEQQDMEMHGTGQLFEREDALYVLYEENPGIAGKTVRNFLKIEKNPCKVSLKKSGAVSWAVAFEEERHDVSEYQTPFGALLMEVETESVQLERTGRKISLQLVYTLFIQGTKQAVCRLELEIYE